MKELYDEKVLNKKKVLYIILGVIVIAAIALIIYNSSKLFNSQGKSVKIYNNELFYTDNISTEEVDKLVKYLQYTQVFTKNTNMDVKIDKKKDIYIFSLIINKEYLEDERLNSLAKSLSRGLSNGVFNNKVEVHICDNKLHTLRVVSD